jgi:hypothetical protein
MLLEQAKLVFAINIVVVVVVAVVIMYLVKSFGLDFICLFKYVKI